jgi:hypothetical protein
MSTSKIMKLAVIATATAAATIALPVTANAHVNSGPTPYVTYTFQSPSGNIACDYQQGLDGDDATGYVSCEVRDHTWVAPPAACTGPYNDRERAQNMIRGDEFPLSEGKPAELGCYWGVGPLNTPHKSTLDYGQTLSVGTITCDSETSGVTCTDSSTGHFFRVSRESYDLG